MITQNQLKILLTYDLNTGNFRWLNDNRQKKIKGMLAGCIDSCGYVIIRFNYKNHKAHRLAWLYHYGELPKGQIDHINGVRNDNRIENLRDVTSRVNCQNRNKHRNGRLVGASFNKILNTYSAFITYNKVQFHIGNYKTEQEANNIYIEAQQNLNNFIEWFVNNKKVQQSIRQSKIKGYSYHKPSNRWYASIRINKKKVHLGSFLTKEEAHKAYLERKYK